jgi:hypothetical protein
MMMKKVIGIVSVIVLFVVVGFMLFYHSASEPPHGSIASKVPPTWEPTPTMATSSPVINRDDYIPSEEFQKTATDADFVLIGINIARQAKPQDVIALYGQPQSKTKKPEEPGYVEWHYPNFDIKIATSSNLVTSVRINQSDYKTVRNIGIGDPVEKIFEKYGIHDEFRSTSSSGWISYRKDYYSINFVMENGKVDWIFTFIEGTSEE